MAKTLYSFGHSECNRVNSNLSGPDAHQILSFSPAELDLIIPKHCPWRFLCWILKFGDAFQLMSSVCVLDCLFIERNGSCVLSVCQKIYTTFPKKIWTVAQWVKP